MRKQETAAHAEEQEETTDAMDLVLSEEENDDELHIEWAGFI